MIPPPPASAFAVRSGGGPGWRPKDERFGPTLAHEKLTDAALAWDFVIDSASEPQREPRELELARTSRGAEFELMRRRPLRNGSAWAGSIASPQKTPPLKALGTIFEAAPIAAGSVVQSVLISSGDPS